MMVVHGYYILKVHYDVLRRPCSDSRHVTAPYKSALYYY